MNPHVPEEYGGAGLSSFDGMLMGEELSWGCAGIAVSIVANSLGSGPVMLAGTDEQKARVAPAAHRVADPVRVRPDRAERGVGRLRDPDDGRP